MEQSSFKCVISGFRRDIARIYALTGYYAAYSGDSLAKFRDNLSVPLSRVYKSILSRIYRRLKMGPNVCPETSVRNYHCTLRNILKSADCRSPLETDMQPSSRRIYQFSKQRIWEMRFCQLWPRKWGFVSCGHENARLVRHNAKVIFKLFPAFRRNLLPPSSR
jgi:hypothetical protein